jgi:two-component sensor histidine kinase
MEARDLRMELRMDASPLLVSVTRRFVEEALEKYVADADFVSRVAMTTHELLENAAKYARGGKAQLEVRMDGAPDTRTLTLRLSNATSPDHLDRLKESFLEIDGSEDALGLYLALMRRNAHQSEISGLGLARIRAEGEMTLGLTVDGDRATIVAHAPVPAPEPKGDRPR